MIDTEELTTIVEESFDEAIDAVREIQHIVNERQLSELSVAIMLKMLERGYGAQIKDWEMIRSFVDGIPIEASFHTVGQA